jgi:phosphate transport system substrate-binding protein
VSRPLFFYIKKAHLQIVPGLRDYVLYFLSDDMIGPEGLVTERGLIPMPSAERAQQRENFKAGRILTIK